MDMRFIEKVLEHAKTVPDKPAVYTPAGMITYKELALRVQNAASWLKNEKIRPGDRIMVQAGASLIYIVNYLAVHYLGAVVIPLDRNAMPDSVLQIRAELGASLFLAEADGFQQFEFVRNGNETWKFKGSNEFEPYHPGSLEELSDLLFTTGTTGKSKGVMLSHRAVLGGISNVMNGTGMTSDDVLLIPVPLNHSFGLRELRTVLYLGASAVLMNGFAFAAALKKNIAQYRCTGMTCVPAAIRVLYQQSKGKLQELLGSLHYIEFCTAPLDLQMKQILLEQLPTVTLLNSYGSTESAGAVYLNFSAHPDKLLSIGKPVSGVNAQILDDEYKVIPHSSKERSGRLAILGKMNMSGYWNAPELTDEILKEGWVVSNDIAYLDEDGYIFLLGRANDVINVGGKKVSPVEIENTAILYPGIEECCCIAAEDPKGILGSVPVLFVVSDAPVPVPELKGFLSQKLEAYKLPAMILQIEKIPKNYMGKTDRKALKSIYAELGK